MIYSPNAFTVSTKSGQSEGTITASGSPRWVPRTQMLEPPSAASQNAQWRETGWEYRVKTQPGIPLCNSGYFCDSSNAWFCAFSSKLFFCSFSELPESMCLKFHCGVQIQLGFAAEFSNVMIIYTSVVHKPPEVIMCDAYVTDFPLVRLSSFLLPKM